MYLVKCESIKLADYHEYHNGTKKGSTYDYKKE